MGEREVPKINISVEHFAYIELYKLGNYGCYASYTIASIGLYFMVRERTLEFFFVLLPFRPRFTFSFYKLLLTL